MYGPRINPAALELAFGTFLSESAKLRQANVDSGKSISSMTLREKIERSRGNLGVDAKVYCAYRAGREKYKRFKGRKEVQKSSIIPELPDMDFEKLAPELTADAYIRSFLEDVTDLFARAGIENPKNAGELFIESQLLSFGNTRQSLDQMMSHLNVSLTRRGEPVFDVNNLRSNKHYRALLNTLASESQKTKVILLDNLMDLQSRQFDFYFDVVGQLSKKKSLDLYINKPFNEIVDFLGGKKFTSRLQAERENSNDGFLTRMLGYNLRVKLSKGYYDSQKEKMSMEIDYSRSLPELDNPCKSLSDFAKNLRINSINEHLVDIVEQLILNEKYFLKLEGYTQNVPTHLYKEPEEKKFKWGAQKEIKKYTRLEFCNQRTGSKLPGFEGAIFSYLILSTITHMPIVSEYFGSDKNLGMILKTSGKPYLMGDTPKEFVRNFK